MTTSDRIWKALSGLNIPLSYRDSYEDEFPRLSYSLIGNYAIKASNRRHTQVPIYQIDYFCEAAIDIESEILQSITVALEAQQLVVSSWREVVTIDIEVDSGLYHYYIEVR